MTPRRWALALLACAGGVLASCSSNSTPQTTTTTTHHRSTTTSSSTTTTSSSTTTSTTAGSSACNHITATPGQSSGAAGTITGTITVTNTGGTACTVDGYPKMALFSGGTPLTVTMVNGLTVSVTPQSGAQPIAFPLAPSASAQFAYQYSDVPVGNETSCPSSQQASVTMPAATTASPMFAFTAAPCNHGTIRVSAVYATS